MADTVKGLFAGNDTNNVLFTDRRDFYITPNTFAELWPSHTPFLTNILQKEARTPADPVFKMFEHRAPWRNQYLQVDNDTDAIGANDTGATISVKGNIGLPDPSTTNGHPAYIGLKFEVWDSTKTTRKGVVICTDVNTSTLTLKNLGSTSITPANNDYLYVIGNGKGEGDTAKDGWHDDLQVVWNQCGIMETVVEVDGTLLAASLRGSSNEFQRLVQDKAKEHAVQMERNLLFDSSPLGANLNHNESFGLTYRTNADSKNIRTTMGAISALLKYGSSDATSDDQNIFTVPMATYSYANFVDDMEKVSRYLPNSGTFTAFASRKWMSFFSKVGVEGFAGNSGWKVQVSGFSDSKLGYSIKTLETPHCVLNLVPTPAFEGPWANYLYIPSLDDIFNATYRPDVYEMDIKKDDGYDGRKDHYFSDRGIGITLLEKHKLFKLV